MCQNLEEFVRKVFIEQGSDIYEHNQRGIENSKDSVLLVHCNPYSTKVYAACDCDVSTFGLDSREANSRSD
jgi:hypothetical protein